MKISLVVIVLLNKALIGEICEALNVTVSPGPVAMFTEGENVTLSCHVSQQKKTNSLLVVRWMFSLVPDEEHLLVKMNMRKVKIYGNYTKGFNQQKLQFSEGKTSKIYNLVIFNFSKEDKGNYTCKVQEIRKHQNKWRATSNGTGTAELRVHISPVLKTNGGIWSFFEDLFLCAALICSVGIMCMLLFTIIIICQCIFKKRRFKARYYLVKCPQNSSGETVTSVISSSPGQTRKEKKSKKKKSKENADVPPEIPAKAPIPDTPRRPKLLKTQSRKLILPKIAEESLTYAELELVKPQPENKSVCTGTVYAQILFEEKQL
ncbi:V-set and transmembrane domain-containing protein 4-like [Acipenser oxyrinchus oxyrinchus]|uniref:V-set and transmembrane domain-containing protein 4-like n=1 Tax=Acipenser oxyrinchus oxyrinchus TaxID=40147 RepID=A0AAD8DC04_ACIOX|nr:V-set and transmembrane domain-containing protein 4-like [Acipenser oxyrinchus oxyrinchus]